MNIEKKPTVAVRDDAKLAINEIDYPTYLGNGNMLIYYIHLHLS